MQTRRIQRALIIALGGCVVGALAFPGVALGFDAMKSTNGFFINRESSDSTAAASITVYWGYKGGEQSWSTTYFPTFSGSYNYNETWANLWQSDTDGIEIPLKAGYRLQQVRISQAGGLVRAFAVINEPLDVAVENTPTVNIGTQPAVSLSSSVSVAGTMPVDIQAVPEWFEGLAALAAAVMGFAVVSFVWGWRTR